jgi:hypothetical protein
MKGLTGAGMIEDLDRSESHLVRFENLDFDAFLAQAQGLPADQKLELLQKLLPSPMQVIMGGSNQMEGTVVIQINMADRACLADVLEAMSGTLRKATENPNHRS